MKRTKVGTTLIVLGFLLVAAGVIPLTRRVIVTQEKVIETVEYKEETKTRQETYYEETVVGTESKKEVLLEDTVTASPGGTPGSLFDLTEGDIITLEAHADNEIMVTFSGQGEIYISSEIGTDIEKEFVIKKGGQHTLLYSSRSVVESAVIDFYVVRMYEEDIVEQVEKTRTVEYIEQVPYTVEVPITEKTAQKEQYTLDYLRYAGIGVIIIGVVVYLQRPKSKKSKKKSKKK